MEDNSSTPRDDLTTSPLPQHTGTLPPPDPALAPAGPWVQTAVPEVPFYFVAVERTFGGPIRYEAEAPTAEEARELLCAIEADRTVCPEPAADKGSERDEMPGGGEAEDTICPELAGQRETNEALERRAGWFVAKAEELKVTIACLRDEAGLMREAAEKWREKHAAVRAVLAILVTEITALPQCFSCKANAGHFDDCPVGEARDLLEGEGREKGATDGG